MIGLVLAALMLVLIVAQVTGVAGSHGPGRHVGGFAPAPAPAGSPADGERGW